MRRTLWLAFLVGVASTAAAQESQSQFLPEVDAFFKVTPSGRILALGGGLSLRELRTTTMVTSGSTGISA